MAFRPTPVPTELPADQLARVHSINIAIAYYRDLAKTRLALPKRDDADLAVEIKPEIHELVAAAIDIEDYIVFGCAPTAEGPDPTHERITDLEAVVGWLLSGYDSQTYVDQETLERINPLGEVIAEIREQTGVDVSGDAERLVGAVEAT